MKTKIRKFLEKTILVLLIGFILWMGVIQFHRYMTQVWYNYLYSEIQKPVIVTQLPLERVGVEVKIRRVFAKDAPMALAVFKAESHLRCEAESDTQDYGPAQINTVHTHRWPLEQIKDCTQNILIAKVIFDEQSWTPWSAYKNGSYKKYLNED